MTYEVKVYLDYEVEANNEGEALEEAESKFAEEIENCHWGFTEIFSFDITKLEEVK